MNFHEALGLKVRFLRDYNWPMEYDHDSDLGTSQKGHEMMLFWATAKMLEDQGVVEVL